MPLLFVALLGSGTVVAQQPIKQPPSSRVLARAIAQFYTRPDSVLPLAHQAERLARAAHDLLQQGSAWNTIGAFHYTRDEYKPALQAFTKALVFYEQVGGMRERSSVLSNLGALCLTMELFEPSYQYFQRGITLSLKHKPDSSQCVLYLRGSGVALAALGRYPDALDRYHRSLHLDRRAHDLAGEAATLGYIGAVYVKQRRFAEAIETLETVRQMSAKLPDGLTDVEVLQGLGDAYKGLGQWAKAATYYQARIEAERFSTSLDAYKNLAEVQFRAGKFEQAYRSLNRFVGINDTLKDQEAVRQAHELETRYRTRDLQRTNQIQQLTIARKNQLAAFGFGTAGLVLLAAAGLTWLIVQRTRANRRLAEANAVISQAVAEKEILLQEVHHRVKNNLQLVSGLLGWQAETDPVAAPALQQSRARLHSMALIHEHLYRAEDLVRVRLDEYLLQLLSTLEAAHANGQQPIRVTTDLAPLTVEAKEAIPLGLVTNELVINAYKHAFTGRPDGHLHIVLTGADDGATFQLIVADDGVGLPPDMDATASLSLGMQLVKMLTRQLKATLVTEPNTPRGTRFVLSRTA
jgi:two-component sensor histidine kinase